MKIDFNPAMRNSLYLRKNNNKSYSSSNPELSDIKNDTYKRSESISFGAKIFHKNADIGFLKGILTTATSMIAYLGLSNKENSPEEKEFNAKLNDINSEIFQKSKNVANKEAIEKSFQDLDKDGIDDQKLINYFCKRYRDGKTIRPEIDELLKNIPQEFHDVKKHEAQMNGKSNYYILLYQSDDWNKTINAAFDLNQNLLAIHQSFLLKDCSLFENFCKRKELLGVQNKESDDLSVLNYFIVTNNMCHAYVSFENQRRVPSGSRILTGHLFARCNNIDMTYSKDFEIDGTIIQNSINTR